MAKDSKNWESPLEKVFKPYRDIQAVIKRTNQLYKNIHIELREVGGIGKVGSLLAQKQQDFSMPALTTPAVVGGLPVASRLAKPLYLPPQLFAGSAFRESTEPFIKPRILIDGVMNRSFTDSLFSGISSVIGLQSLAGQQALNTLNAAGSIGSATASIALENRYFTDLLPRFSTESAFREATELSIYRLSLLIEVISKLANLGWFLARKILQDIPTDLLETLRSTDPTHIANIMSRYFRKKLDIIANEIIINYPERQDLLDKIFQTHKQGEYNISIPLSLIQADGISKRRFGGEVFMKRGRRIIASYSLSFHAEDLISNESLPI